MPSGAWHNPNVDRRPDWEAAGVIFTDDVSAFEAMKLRMLNGSHSMLAYAGFHAGAAHVRDVMAAVFVLSGQCLFPVGSSSPMASLGIRKRILKHRTTT